MMHSFLFCIFIDWCIYFYFKLNLNYTVKILVNFYDFQYLTIIKLYLFFLGFNAYSLHNFNYVAKYNIFLFNENVILFAIIKQNNQADNFCNQSYKINN